MKKLWSWISIVMLCINAGAQERSGYAVSSDSVRISYTVFGSGKPLLIINGGPGMNSEGFAELARVLSSDRQCILYDQRRTGRSKLAKLDSTTVNMKRMVEDVESLRMALGFEHWSVLGHSFGGMLASYYATLYPNRIDKLILSSSGGIDLELLDYVQDTINVRIGKPDLDSVAYWSGRIAGGDTTHAAKLSRGRFLAKAYVVDPKWIPNIAERLTQLNGAVNGLIWNDLISMEFNCAEKLKAFSSPVLIIQGKQDIVRRSTAEKAKTVFSHSRIVYVDHSSHYGWLDNPGVYVGEIRKFLSH